MKAKSSRLMILILILIMTTTLSAQVMLTSWMRSFGAEEDAYCKAITTDAQGNIYMAGWFSGSSLQMNEITLYKNTTEIANQDIFIAKFDPSGYCLWARNYGGEGTEFISDIIVDVSGKIYICGDFYSPEISFGKFNLRNHSKIISSSFLSADIFVVGLDERGLPLWAVCGGGVYDDFAADIAFDSNQNIIMGSTFSSYSFSMGGISVANSATNESSLGATEDIILCKLNQSGELNWLRAYGDVYRDEIKALAIDKENNIFTAGSFTGKEIRFGSISVTKATEDMDIWYARFDAEGNPFWLKTAEGNGADEAVGIALDSGGSVYLTGSFNSNCLNFKPHIIRNNQGDQSIFNSFLAKYDPDGVFSWVKAIGGKGNDFADDVVVLNSDVIVLSCSVQSDKIEIDDISYVMQQGSISPDCLYICFNCDGGIFDTTLIGGSEGDYPTSVTRSDDYSFIAAGVFDSTVLYEAENTLSNIDMAGNDIYLVRYKIGILP